MPHVVIAPPPDATHNAHYAGPDDPVAMRPNFNTLTFSERLAKGGFSRQQAQTQALALAELLTVDALGAATKADLQALERSLLDEAESRLQRQEKSILAKMDSRLHVTVSQLNAAMEHIDLRKAFAVLREDFAALHSELRLLKWLIGLTAVGAWGALLKPWLH